ncbi:MAG: Do family serine endopeptidase [Bdellovibrionales bacterium]
MKLTTLLVVALSFPISTFAADLSTAFIDLAKKVNPAVVNIRTTQMPKQRYMADPFMDLFQEFYGFKGQRPQRRPSNALGTGFIISKDGLIITNNHVIAEADEIEVQLNKKDSKLFKAKVIGKDAKTDLALIKIDSDTDLPTIKLGNSTKVQVGEWVAAFGNPLGLGHTMTKGVVSAKGREVEEIGIYPFIQTDASINPGNSGGPLVNLKGEVIGVNTFIIKGAQGLGFAIPVDAVKTLLPQLKSLGRVARGYMGIAIEPITPRIKKAFNLKSNKGILITNVENGSPADRAGFEAYDIIRKINGKEILGPRKLQAEIARFPAGEKIKVEIIRNQKPRTLELVLLEKKAIQESKPRLSRNNKSLTAPYKLGFEVANMNPQMAKRLGAGNAKNPYIFSVESRGPAAAAGLAVGDIILDINRKKIDSAREAIRALRKKDNLVRVRRGNYIIVLFIEN